MAEHRTITYPTAMVETIACELCDIDPNMPFDQAEELALNFVIAVTMAVDKLRAKEAEGA